MSSTEKPSRTNDEIDRRVAEIIKKGLPTVIVVGVVLAGIFVGAATALLVAAGGALVAVIAMFWSSLRTLLGETPLSSADAYVFGAPPRAEEEQKRAVLRALKDIEFERNVGKISKEDHAELAAKYRAEAKRLLQALDEQSAPGRARAEALVMKKLRQAGLVEPAARDIAETNADDTTDKPIEEERSASTESAAAAVAMIMATKRPVRKKKAKKKPAYERAEAALACAKCGATNDKDAVFCKKCGARVGTSEDAEKKTEGDEEASAS